MNQKTASGSMPNAIATRLVLAIAVALAMACGSVPAALAGEQMATSDQIAITVHVEFATGFTHWSSSGALFDEGTVAPLHQVFGSALPPSPQWTIHEDILFSGQAGSFTIRQQALFIDLTPTLSVGTSRWVVRSGTGAYAGLHGHGTGTLTVHWDVGTLDITVVGVVDVPAT